MAGLPPGAAQTLPWSWYSDPEALPREQERIFKHAWQYAGPVEHIAEQGRFFTCRIGEIPVIVVRGRDERLRAFLNSAGTAGRSSSGGGRRETLQCNYHAWTYDLDGKLRAAPRSNREPAFDADGISLLELVSRPGARSCSSIHPPTRRRSTRHSAPLRPTSPPPGSSSTSSVSATAASTSSSATGKSRSRTTSSDYHCPTAHPGFSKVVDVNPDAYRLETHARSSSQFGPLRETDGAKPELVEGQFHWLWPVTKLYALPGPQNLAAGPVFPLGAARSGGWLDYFFREDSADAEVAELIAFDDQVGSEDRVLVESVQRGVSSGLIDARRLMPESEQLLAHFQELVREALA